jgi:hypothetical protein
MHNGTEPCQQSYRHDLRKGLGMAGHRRMLVTSNDDRDELRMTQ